MFDVPLRPSTKLTGGIDLEALVAVFPDHYFVKGMFCNRLVDVLGEDFEALRPHLIAPPRGERYLPFKDYPQADYTRIVVATAAKEFPGLDLAEASRRVAREDFATFATSTLGKITLSLVGDPHTALLRMPEAYVLVAPGPELSTEERDARTVRLTFVRHHGAVEYMLGQLEGIVMAYGKSPCTTIRRASQFKLIFDVEHG